MDVTVAYRQTILRCIEYLRRFGYSDYQVYLLLSCAPVQGHVAGIVDIPNACTTLGLPMEYVHSLLVTDYHELCASLVPLHTVPQNAPVWTTKKKHLSCFTP